MIDWQTILLELRRDFHGERIVHPSGSKRGLTAIAMLVGSDWAHINRLARGEVAEPKYSVGVKILDLHKKYCKKC